MMESKMINQIKSDPGWGIHIPKQSHDPGKRVVLGSSSTDVVVERNMN